MERTRPTGNLPEDAGTDLPGSQPIVALCRFGEMLVIFRSDSIWAVLGSDPETWTIIELVGHVGLVAPLSLVEIKGVLYFGTVDGIYGFDGRAVTQKPIAQ